MPASNSSTRTEAAPESASVGAQPRDVDMGADWGGPSTPPLNERWSVRSPSSTLLAWSQEQLATAADLSIPIIKRLEAQDGPLGGRNITESKIRSALQNAGIEFIDENGGGPGVRLRKDAK